MGKNNNSEVKVSLLVSTYEKPVWLKVCLESVRRQVVLPHEVVICDDGSGEETIKLIDELRKDFPIPIVHVWQPNKGHTGVSSIRNQGIVKCSGDYIIQIDGDMLLHPYFVADHISFSKKGCYLKGTRTYLSEKISKEILKKGEPMEISFWTADGVEKRRTNLLRIPMFAKLLASRYGKNSTAAIGCNVSFWRDDAIRINGYDEGFDGFWGVEDEDFGSRLIRSGIEKRYLKFCGNAFHIWHPTQSRDNTPSRNRKADNDAKGIVYAEKGIDQYL